jgi:hypothetical protein
VEIAQIVRDRPRNERRLSRGDIDVTDSSSSKPTGKIDYACEECSHALESPDHFALLVLFCPHCLSPTQVPAAASGERWREIRGLNGIFEVSDLGRVRRVRPGRGAKVGNLMEPRIDPKTGQSIVSLTRGGGVDQNLRIHNLVWQAFKAPVPPQMHVGHVDATRNDSGALDNRLTNLQLLPGKRA